MLEHIFGDVEKQLKELYTERSKLDQDIIKQLKDEGISDNDLLKAQDVLLNLQLENDNILMQNKFEKQRSN